MQVNHMMHYNITIIDFTDTRTVPLCPIMFAWSTIKPRQIKYHVHIQNTQ